MTTTTTTDRIEREIHLKAPVAKVWRAISNAEEFGNWFGAALKGKTFTPGASVQGQITGCGGDEMLLDLAIQRIEPETLLSFRWHPYAEDSAADRSQEPTTLVEFHLAPADGGTLLKVIESGFDGLPLSRRLEAFGKHTDGWNRQLQNIEKYVGAA